MQAHTPRSVKSKEASAASPALESHPLHEPKREVESGVAVRVTTVPGNDFAPRGSRTNYARPARPGVELGERFVERLSGALGHRSTATTCLGDALSHRFGREPLDGDRFDLVPRKGFETVAARFRRTESAAWDLAPSRFVLSSRETLPVRLDICDSRSSD